jgi:hypothetical protein
MSRTLGGAAEATEHVSAKAAEAPKTVESGR